MLGRMPIHRQSKSTSVFFGCNARAHRENIGWLSLESDRIGGAPGKGIAAITGRECGLIDGGKNNHL